MSDRKNKIVIFTGLAAPIFALILACVESSTFYPEMFLGAVLEAVLMAFPIRIFLGSKMVDSDKKLTLTLKELIVCLFFILLNFGVSFFSNYIELHPTGGGAAMTLVPIILFVIPGECLLALLAKKLISDSTKYDKR